jgi:hypothetical protein
MVDVGGAFSEGIGEGEGGEREEDAGDAVGLLLSCVARA